VVGRKQKAADRTCSRWSAVPPLPGSRRPCAPSLPSGLALGTRTTGVSPSRSSSLHTAMRRYATRGQRHCGRGVKQCFDLWWDAPPTEKEWLLAEFETAMQALTAVPIWESYTTWPRRHSLSLPPTFPHLDRRFRQQVLGLGPWAVFSSTACELCRRGPKV
jgi:hypothetical protein